MERGGKPHYAVDTAFPDLSRQHPDFKTQPAAISGLKRDGPVFFSPAPVKVAGDERTIIAIVAPRRRG
jgi:hypothetical protein